MRIKINESEKNRIKSLHKNYSIIKEQDACPPSDMTSPFHTNSNEFCANCGPGAYYFNHDDCPCCDGGQSGCDDPNSPFNTNLPEFCYVQNGVYHHQQTGMSYYNHPDADCCGPIVDDNGSVLDLDDDGKAVEKPIKGGANMIGGGSGFENKQGSSDRLNKYNKRQSRDINEEVTMPVGPGNIMPLSSTGGILQRRKPKGNSREMNEYKTKTIGSMPLCCLWGCGGCKWTWGGGQWNPPVGSGNMSAGKYANVAPNKSNKRLYNNIKELGEEKVKKGDCSCSGYVHQPGVGKRKAKVCCGDKSHECKKDRDCRNVGSKIDIGKSYNRNNIDLKAKPSSGGNFRMGEDVNMIGSGSGFENKQGSSDRLNKYNERQTRLEGKSKVKVNLTETELISYIKKSILNEQQNPCIDPSTIDPQYQPLGVACLCSLNVGWSNGNQYGGTIELDGCMPPNGSVFRIYVNDNFAAQGSSFSFSANIPWQGQQTPIIKVKTVLECTGQHPACSEETIEKSICVERSTGNRVSCGKRLPDNPLKSDETKSVYNPDGGSQLDIDSLNKKGSMTNYKPSQSSHSSYGKETTNLRESDLIRLIRRAVNEQQTTSWNCEDGKCVPVVGKGGVGDFATLQDCEDSNCEERARPTGTGVRRHDRDMAKRRPYSAKYTDMRGSRNESVRRQKLNEGPICGNKSGEPCGEACGDGYTWQDSNASNSCICNHSNGKVCHNTSPTAGGGHVKGTKTPSGTGKNVGLPKGWQYRDTSDLY